MICTILKNDLGLFNRRRSEASSFKALYYEIKCFEGDSRFPAGGYTLYFKNLPFEFAFIIEKRRRHTMLHSLAENSKSKIETRDESVTELAKMWLKQCQEEHLSCPKPAATNWQPTRLLKASEDSVRPSYS